LPSGGSLTAFHGTDIESACTLLRGEPLDVEKAAAHKIDGPPGFFLATEVDDTMFFALRRAPGGVLAFRFSLHAVEQLQAAGMIRHQIPPGKTIRFMGDEMVIPPAAFEVFNGLRAVGEIFVTPAL
jgi:hypothetical protein